MAIEFEEWTLLTCLAVDEPESHCLDEGGKMRWKGLRKMGYA